MLTGAEDRIWPATMMAEQLIARLHVAEFEYKTKHLPFADAGHGIAVPPGEPTTGLSGGTARGNAHARESGWNAARSFFSESLLQ